VGNAFDDTEVEEVRKSVAIGRPVGGLTSGEMVEIKLFHLSDDLTAARCNKSGSPVGMFGIVVASCYEPTPKGNYRRLLAENV
jgi:hypothetical protein